MLGGPFLQEHRAGPIPASTLAGSRAGRRRWPHTVGPQRITESVCPALSGQGAGMVLAEQWGARLLLWWAARLGTPLCGFALRVEAGFPPRAGLEEPVEGCGEGQGLALVQLRWRERCMCTRPPASTEDCPWPGWWWGRAWMPKFRAPTSHFPFRLCPGLVPGAGLGSVEGSALLRVPEVGKGATATGSGLHLMPLSPACLHEPRWARGTHTRALEICCGSHRPQRVPDAYQ